jgi:hypothetical protein
MIGSATASVNLTASIIQAIEAAAKPQTST